MYFHSNINLDTAHINTWRPFRPTSLIWTPPTSAHGVHSAPHPQSGRHPHQHMASIPPSIHNLDATPTLTWRPFRPTSPIRTPHQLSHGVHSAQHLKSGRRTLQHMASIPLNIPNLDATPTLTWRPFRPTSQIRTPHTPAHGVHSSANFQSGRQTNSHMASIPPHIPNLDAAHSSTWRPFLPTSLIWTPPTPAHGVHSSANLQSGRHTNSHMASIPPHIHNLDAAHSSTWRPFRPTSTIWTPPTPAHGVHSAPHPQSGRRPLQHMASIPPHIPNLDATPTLTWRPFRPTSQIWTPHPPSHGVHSAPHPQSGRRPHQHMASIPPHISNLDATHISSWRPFRQTSTIWTPLTPKLSHPASACTKQPARWAYIFQKIPLSDIKMHNFIPLLKSDESYCTMALTTILLEIGGQLSGYCRAMGVDVFKFLNVDFERGVGVYGY